MTLLDLAVLVAATHTLVHGWFTSPAFVVPREYAKVWQTSNSIFPWLLGELLDCPFCLSVQVAICLSYLFHIPTIYSDDVCSWFRPVMYGLAVAAVTTQIPWGRKADD